MKLKSFFIALFCSVLSLQLSAQVGKPFPLLKAETVDSKVVNLPKDTQDKYTLLGLAYSKKSEKDLMTWFSPIYQKFVYKSKKPSVFSSFAHDVNVFFVPMFTGVKAAATGAAKKQAMKNLDPKLLPHVLFYKGVLKEYKEKLGFDKKDVPYFFVVDKSGKIVYSTSGAFTPSKMDKIEEAVDEGL